MKLPSISYIVIPMSKLTPKEAKEAAARRRNYEHSMAIEGIFLTDEEKELFAHIERERMGYEEGVQYTIQYLQEKGIITPDYNKENLSEERPS